MGYKYDVIKIQLQSREEIIIIGKVGRKTIDKLFKDKVIESVCYTKGKIYTFFKRK